MFDWHDQIRSLAFFNGWLYQVREMCLCCTCWWYSWCTFQYRSHYEKTGSEQRWRPLNVYEHVICIFRWRVNTMTSRIKTNVFFDLTCFSGFTPATNFTSCRPVTKKKNRRSGEEQKRRSWNTCWPGTWCGQTWWSTGRRWWHWWVGAGWWYTIDFGVLWLEYFGVLEIFFLEFWKKKILFDIIAIFQS